MRLSILFRLRAAFLLLVYTFSLAAAPAAEPAWWSAPATKIWQGSAVNVENFSPVNIGQLKHVASMAKLHLDSALSLVGGAGPEITAMVNSFGSGLADPENHAIANAGQLKAVAAPFYRRFANPNVGFNAITQLQLTMGLQPAQVSSENGVSYPWTVPASGEHFSPANVGQLKLVFGFNLSGWAPAPGDSDNDGLPDWWERFHFGNTATQDGTDDSDGDLLTNAEELAFGTSGSVPDSQWLEPGSYDIKQRWIDLGFRGRWDHSPLEVTPWGNGENWSDNLTSYGIPPDSYYQRSRGDGESPVNVVGAGLGIYPTNNLGAVTSMNFTKAATFLAGIFNTVGVNFPWHTPSWNQMGASGGIALKYISPDTKQPNETRGRSGVYRYYNGFDDGTDASVRQTQMRLSVSSAQPFPRVLQLYKFTKTERKADFDTQDGYYDNQAPPPGTALTIVENGHALAELKTGYIEQIRFLIPPSQTESNVVTLIPKWQENQPDLTPSDRWKVVDAISVSLPTMNVESLDKYVEVHIPENVLSEFTEAAGDFSLKMSNASGESYEVSLGTANIYDATMAAEGEGVFFPAAEAAASTLDPKAYDENVAPIAVALVDGIYRFSTCFDKTGPIKVEFKNKGAAVATMDYVLRPHQDMSDLIDQLEGIFRESFEYRNFGGGNPALMAAMNQMMQTHGGGAGSGPQTLSFWATITNRNLVAKCCSAVYDTVKDAIREGAVFVAEGVKVAVVGAQGFCTGFWAGIKSDMQSVTEFATMLAHPIDSGKAIYEGFRGLLSMSLEQLKGIPKKMLEEFLTDAQKNIQWADPSGLDLIAYTTGYSAGYLAEQVLLSVIKAVCAPLILLEGAIIGAKIAKVMNAFKAGTKILGAVQAGKETIAKVQRAKNMAVKSCTQFVMDKTGLDKIEAIVKQTLTAGCPVPAP